MNTPTGLLAHVDELLPFVPMALSFRHCYERVELLGGL